MRLKDVTPEKFIETVLLNQYLPPMYLPEPFATHTSVRALYTTWLYRKKPDDIESYSYVRYPTGSTSVIGNVRSEGTGSTTTVFTNFSN